MRYLLSTPDFDGLPCLQKLILHSCDRLAKIHPSLGNHKSLEYVSITDCQKLRMFPKIVQMKKLKNLKIHFGSISCQVEFPKVESNMESLVELSLEFMVIDTLLSSIGERCANLISVDLRGCYVKTNEANFDGLRHLEKFTLRGLSNLNMPGNILCTSWLNMNKFDPESYIRPLLVFPRFTHLRELNLVYCGLTDGAMPSDFGEIFNLDELCLSLNNFTRLDFSLSQLTRLKVLILSYCDELLELPELPSGLIILRADYCHSLATIADFYTNCNCLCDVSLDGVGIICDGDKLQESMLQGKAVENHCIVLTLEDREIAKEFIPPLLMERGYTLELPDNWRNNFSGFLMCGVLRDGFSSWHQQKISIKQVMSGMDSHNDWVWEDSDSDRLSTTTVLYISFASLRHTKWWDETHREVLFYIENKRISRDSWRGFGVRLVAKKNVNGPTDASTIQEEQDFSHYTLNVEILRDTQYALEFLLKYN